MQLFVRTDKLALKNNCNLIYITNNVSVNIEDCYAQNILQFRKSTTYVFTIAFFNIELVSRAPIFSLVKFKMHMVFT